MAIDTHGLEALRKSAEEVTPGDPSDAYIKTKTIGVPGFDIPTHDDIVLSYTGSNLTQVVYKLLTVTVATLTLSYTGSRLDQVTKS